MVFCGHVTTWSYNLSSSTSVVGQVVTHVVTWVASPYLEDVENQDKREMFKKWGLYEFHLKDLECKSKREV